VEVKLRLQLMISMIIFAANVVSTVPPTEYMDKLFDVDTSTLKFILDQCL